MRLVHGQEPVARDTLIRRVLDIIRVQVITRVAALDNVNDSSVCLLIDPIQHCSLTLPVLISRTIASRSSKSREILTGGCLQLSTN